MYLLEILKNLKMFLNQTIKMEFVIGDILLGDLKTAIVLINFQSFPDSFLLLLLFKRSSTNPTTKLSSDKNIDYRGHFKC